jgi:Ca2+-binding RTX toxin-like protein
MVVVASFLMGWAILLVVGGSGVQATATEEQGHSDDRCEGTRFVTRLGSSYTTNDVPGCPGGGLLSGTDNTDRLAGEDGDDEIRGLGAINSILGGVGNDVIYGGPDADSIEGGPGEDVIYGGDGNDKLDESSEGSRDKLYCGEGKDVYRADKIDFVDSSCEEGKLYPLVDTGGAPLILPAGALLLGAGLLLGRSVIRRAS